jgi:3-hydroxyisobutyrate dehydrogenase-like beta-hydroxyacid dehydrogenase
MGLADDAIKLGVAFGLDGERLTSALLHGSSSNMSGTTMLVRTREMLAALSAGDSPPSATVNWASKDVALTIHEAQQQGIAVDRPVLVLGRAGAQLATPRPT